MILLRTINLWSITQTARTLVNNTHYWFVPTTINATGFVADATLRTNYWYEVDIGGADFAILQYTSQLHSVTDITAVTEDNVMVACQGMMWVPDNPALNKPHTVRADRVPPDFRNVGDVDWSSFPICVSRLSAAKVNDDLNRYANLPAYGTDTGNTNADGTKEVDHHRGCIFLLGNIADAQSPLPPLNRTPLNTDFPGWAVWLHTRFANTMLTQQAIPYPRISGMRKLWIAVAHHPRFTAGAAPAVTITGSLDLVLLRDSPGSIR